jgi:hypothetical protein
MVLVWIVFTVFGVFDRDVAEAIDPEPSLTEAESTSQIINGEMSEEGSEMRRERGWRDTLDHLSANIVDLDELPMSKISTAAASAACRR